MTVAGPGTSPRADRPSGLAPHVRAGPLAPFLAVDEVLEVRAADPVPHGRFETVVAAGELQRIADYRGAIQTWFDAVAPGGHLVLTVPHAFLYERRTALAARQDLSQRRLYTPRSLLEEVEEALTPNSYRVRMLFDDDHAYNYALSDEAEPEGSSDVVLVVERIDAPAWPLEPPDERRADAPDYAFEPARTRLEIATDWPARRILLLKLDHLGDFIMSIGALRKARALFADAHITLVVGSWNLDMAEALEVADEVIAFDAFPRNSMEEEVDVPGSAGQFRARVTGSYDLAIDLRTDHDARFLLRSVRAEVRAGLGTRAQFPFLDIFLPIDFSRDEPETAREFIFDVHAFQSQAVVARHRFRHVVPAIGVERGSAILWGPYRHLRPGRYIFEPLVELNRDTAGLLEFDVALDTKRVASAVISSDEQVRLAFAVEVADAQFEFRAWTVPDAPVPAFSFFGGRLIRAGADSVLHQSEYQSLLIQLVHERLEIGLLRNTGG